MMVQRRIQKVFVKILHLKMQDLDTFIKRMGKVKDVCNRKKNR